MEDLLAKLDSPESVLSNQNTQPFHLSFQLKLGFYNPSYNSDVYAINFYSNVLKDLYR